jgi:cyclophilin family peptidyl-prolyl cis-trans isomerase
MRWLNTMRILSLTLIFAALAAVGAQADFIEDFELTDPGLYAVFQTSMGTFVAELFEEGAPNTVANFVGLVRGDTPWRRVDKQALIDEMIAEGIQIRTRDQLNEMLEERIQELPIENTPFYEGVIFHRVISNFMIQCGAPVGIENPGAGGPGYAIDDEFNPELLHSEAGCLSMANSGPNSGGSQIFITVRPAPELNFNSPMMRQRGGGHAVFGQVIRNYEVVDAIRQVPTDPDDRPLEDVVIERIAIERVGDEAAEMEPVAPEAVSPEATM